MESATVSIRIPKNRVGVLIGKKGAVLRQIEKKVDSKIKVDSETGEVVIKFKENLGDPVLKMKSKGIIKAIGRGFSPEQALILAKDDYYLDIISLKEDTKGSKKDLARLRSRLIGKEGLTRKNLEESTETKIVIMGSTVSIIGKYLDSKTASDGIYKIIRGSDLNSVYSWLREKKKEKDKLMKDKIWEVKVPSLEEMDELLKAEKNKEDLDLSEEFDDILKADEN